VRYFPWRPSILTLLNTRTMHLVIAGASHPVALGDADTPSIGSPVLCSLLSALSSLPSAFSPNTVRLMTPWTLWTIFALDVGTLVLYHGCMEIQALHALCRDSRPTTRPCCRSSAPAYRTGSPEVVPLRFKLPFLALSHFRQGGKIVISTGRDVSYSGFLPLESLRIRLLSAVPFEPHLNYFAHGDIQSPLRTSAPRGAEACFRDAREWPITQY
jgi:hypothetical protein